MQKLSLIRPLTNAFTLIELMIVIAIIAILATVVIPSYNSYTQKAALSELLAASASYKTDVEICIYNTGDSKNCSGGQNGVRKMTELRQAKYLNTITVEGGTITVTGKGNLQEYGYTMTPIHNGSTISWETKCKGEDLSLFPANFCVSN
ncbi:prepilin-type N-terminal cleavage/methylation domain-containing protein [Actinobacillus lignieresii]|uniref:Prepilin peptidase dependent protein D n=1 Tax=Actinobacillus lignieresii TaxID=720 RepID=A0A380TRQ2_ACTLI|nr:prepilin-type N-terminal cleavage/methylation domain-containing protein [Actinobacillus lignieresii]SUT90944.1 prepilin peptidase dependent protein D [Actinobacillus lignieresii]